MGRIVVFDSGLGSLSVIRPLRAAVKADVVYIADTQNYPYGAKSEPQLRYVIVETIRAARSSFSPDLIIVGSNTPSILLPDLLEPRILGVLPPVREAARRSRARSIAVLVTRASARSRALSDYVASQDTRGCRVTKVDATELVEIVESGRFMTQKTRSARIAHDLLAPVFSENNIDVATLSSTHLPLMLPIFERAMPHVTFLDPAADVAARAARLLEPDPRSVLRVYTTGKPARLAAQLARLGMRRKVKPFMI